MKPKFQSASIAMRDNRSADQIVGSLCRRIAGLPLAEAVFVLDEEDLILAVAALYRCGFTKGEVCNAIYPDRWPYPDK